MLFSRVAFNLSASMLDDHHFFPHANPKERLQIDFAMQDAVAAIHVARRALSRLRASSKTQDAMNVLDSAQIMLDAYLRETDSN